MLVRIGCELEHQSPEVTPPLWHGRPRPTSSAARSPRPGTVRPQRAATSTARNARDFLALATGHSIPRDDVTVEFSADVDEYNTSAAGRPSRTSPSTPPCTLLPTRCWWPYLLHEAAWDPFGSGVPGWSLVQPYVAGSTISLRNGSARAPATAYDMWESRALHRGSQDVTHVLPMAYRRAGVP